MKSRKHPRRFIVSPLLGLVMALVLVLPVAAVGEGSVLEVSTIANSEDSQPASPQENASEEEVIVVGGSAKPSTAEAIRDTLEAGSDTVTSDMGPADEQGIPEADPHLYFFTVDGELYETYVMTPGALSVAPEVTPPLEGYAFLFWYDYFEEEIFPYIFGMPVAEDVFLIPFYLDLNALGVDAGAEDALEDPMVQAIREAIEEITVIGDEGAQTPQEPQAPASVISREQDSLLIDEILSGMSSGTMQQTPVLPEEVSLPEAGASEVGASVNDAADDILALPEALPTPEEGILAAGDSLQAAEAALNDPDRTEPVTLNGDLDLAAFEEDLRDFQERSPEETLQEDGYNFSNELSDTIAEILGLRQPKASVADEEAIGDGEAEPDESEGGEDEEVGEALPDADEESEKDGEGQPEADREDTGEDTEDTSAQEPSEEETAALALAPLGEEDGETGTDAATGTEGIDVDIALYATREGDPFAPGTVVNHGDTVYIIGNIDNPNNLSFSLQWRVNKGNGWERIPGIDGAVYPLLVTEESLTWDFQLQMIVEVEPQQVESAEEEAVEQPVELISVE